MTSREGEAEVAGVRLTNPDRVLDVDSKLTKRDLALYYAAVADAILPHLLGRPLSVVRCPEGSGTPCFYQRHAGGRLPAGVVGIPVKSKTSGKTEQYIAVESAEGLVGLAQIGVLEIHPWGARSDTLEMPDRLIFDFDPGDGIVWEQLVAAAEEIFRVLERYELESFVKWTGGKGLHVVAPIEADHRWDTVREFARGLAKGMEAQRSDLYLTQARKTSRTGKIFVDYLRNERGGTAVAPYSPRARRGAYVAMPLRWEELKILGRPKFAVADFESWKARLRDDPWKRMAEVKQRLKLS